MTAADGAALSRQVAERVLGISPALRDLAPELVSAEPGRVTLALQVRGTQVNGQGIAYGGTLFSLADSAAALTAMSRNEKTVTQTSSVTFLRAALGGTRVVAEAVEVERSGRTTVVDVQVRDGDGALAMLARMQFRAVGGGVVEP